MKTKVYINKVICPDFGRNDLDICRYNNDEFPLVNPFTNLPPRNLQELNFCKLVLISLEWFISLIEAILPDSSFPTLILSSEIFGEPQWY